MLACANLHLGFNGFIDGAGRMFDLLQKWLKLNERKFSIWQRYIANKLRYTYIIAWYRQIEFYIIEC